MKKIYNEPKEIIIELGLQGQLLDVSGGQGPTNDLDKNNTDPETGEEMGNARTQSIWGEW